MVNCILNKELLVDEIINQVDLECSKKDIEKITDIFMQILLDNFKLGKSFHYNEYAPFFKVKRSVAILNDHSPKTPRNDRIVITAKINLDEKTV